MRDSKPGLLPRVYLHITDRELAEYIEILLKDSGLTGGITRCAFVEEALAAAQLAGPSCVFTTGLPLDATAFNRTKRDTTRLTLLSFDLRWTALEAATAAGAQSYIYALSPPEEHRRAIQLILSGRVYFPFKSIVAAQPSASKRPQLTARQSEVLDRLCLGETNAQISRKLGISENTVRLHISAVLRAYGARNRTAVVAAANGNGSVNRSTSEVCNSTIDLVRSY